MLPREVFEACADAGWGIDRSGGKAGGKGSKGEKESDTLVFTRQMAALYRVKGDFILILKWDDYFGGCPLSWGFLRHGFRGGIRRGWRGGDGCEKE